MKNFSPAAERNKDPIFKVLNPTLSKYAKVLEVASGTGQHAVYFAAQRPDIFWQPSDQDETALKSIHTWQEESGLKNTLDPLYLDVLDNHTFTNLGTFDCLVNINMIHIAPWQAFLSLLDLASQHLKTGGIFFLYGPFLVRGKETSPSNLEFDRSLQERDPRWGLRHIEDVIDRVQARGFQHLQLVDMPANNLSLIFQKT